MRTKTIILTNIAILALFFLITNTAPLTPNGDVSERKPTFKWSGLPTSYTVMIDDNPDFTTPIKAEVKGKTYTPENNLELGDHYWKVKGFRESKTQKFTIVSQVSLKREEDENLRNDGNTRLKLDMTPSIVGAVVLDINQTTKLERGTEEVKAKQDE